MAIFAKRQPQAQPGAVRARDDAAALVAHDDGQALGPHGRSDLQRADLVVLVCVDDDVGARLGDRELDVGQHLVGHGHGVAQAADGMSDNGHVLGPRRQSQLEVGRGVPLF